MGNESCKHCKQILIVLIILFIVTLISILLPHKLFGAAFEPFGGRIIKIIPCIIPPNCLYLTLSPPTAGKYVYLFGVSFSYFFGPPSHPGQWLLGFKDGMKWVCIARKRDDCDNMSNWRRGSLIVPYHGSSL